jgi:hypothetical protein
MKAHNYIAIALTFLVAFFIEFFLNPQLADPNKGVDYNSGYLVGAAFGKTAAILIIPVVISLILYFINKKFPAKTFTALVVVFMVFILST